MPPRYIILVSILFLLSACYNSTVKTPAKAHVTMAPKPSTSGNDLNKILIPVFGYRFIVTGDFNGDGKKDTLTEHYVSDITHQETNKFYEGLDYDSLVKITSKKKPRSFITCSDKNINNLPVAESDYLLGLSYLKNEGDLDNDGNDELSYVINWADWSNVNTWKIVTYKNGKWQDLYSFSMRDWQLPDLPETYNAYGLAGLDEKVVNAHDTAANKKIEQRLSAFEGLVKKLGRNKIRVFNSGDDGSSDTTIVRLKKL